MQKYLEERDELTFDKIFNQKIGKFSQSCRSVCRRFVLYRQWLNLNILDVVISKNLAARVLKKPTTSGNGYYGAKKRIIL